MLTNQVDESWPELKIVDNLSLRSNTTRVIVTHHRGSNVLQRAIGFFLLAQHHAKLDVAFLHPCVHIQPGVVPPPKYGSDPESLMVRLPLLSFSSIMTCS